MLSFQADRKYIFWLLFYGLSRVEEAAEEQPAQFKSLVPAHSGMLSALG